jgi:hypothetical protein
MNSLSVGSNPASRNSYEIEKSEEINLFISNIDW